MCEARHPIGIALVNAPWIRSGLAFSNRSISRTNPSSVTCGSQEVRNSAIGSAEGISTLPAARPRRSAFVDLASPYLDGTFEQLLPPDLVRASCAVLETNRGCPFRCTFCDWGQALHSPVRELPFERIAEELAWIAARRIARIYLVDANFGIRPRDLDVAREIARLRRERGYPRGRITVHEQIPDDGDARRAGGNHVRRCLQRDPSDADDGPI